LFSSMYHLPVQNCFYRSISKYVFPDVSAHDDLRRVCAQFLLIKASFASPLNPFILSSPC
jgi:hypothetical protein